MMQSPQLILIIVVSFSLHLVPIFQEAEITTEDCLVPCDQIVSGGPPKDGIPAINAPQFISAEEYSSSYGRHTDLVIGVYHKGIARAYPTDILNWHEIVNDVFSGETLSITYCPLTWSGIAYDTTSINSSTLGTTGRLYENNLVFYDRLTDSYWSQMLGLGLTGEHIGTVLPTIPVVQTTWRTWQALHPQSYVLSRETGHDRDYDRNPYKDYQGNSDIWFPSSYDSSRAPFNSYRAKDSSLVLSFANETRIYPFEALRYHPIVNDVLGNNSIAIIYDAASDLPRVFSSTISNSTYSFVGTTVAGLDEMKTLGLRIFQDHETGSIWNLRGEAIEGFFLGEKLAPVPAYSAFWFASTAIFVPRNATLMQSDYDADVPETPHEPDSAFPDSEDASSYAQNMSLENSYPTSNSSTTGFNIASIALISIGIGFVVIFVRRRDEKSR
ncbi:MAG: DUF3179 domain-containing protein [Candidatus Heimdallarchaeota archaeon]